MNIEKNLYAYLWRNPYENNCNTYVISGDKTVLIDPGHRAHVERVFSEMEEDGIPPETVDLVIVTHSHPDHLEGLEAFSGKPVKVAMSRAEENYVQKHGKALFEMMRQPLPNYQIDFYLREGDLHLGKETFHIYQTPGHSPGSLTIYWPERKVLVTGDLIFDGGIGRTDFQGGNSTLIKESIERMSRLDIEILLPGHGNPVVGKEKNLMNFEFIRQNYYAYL